MNPDLDHFLISEVINLEVAVKIQGGLFPWDNYCTCSVNSSLLVHIERKALIINNMTAF